MSDYENLKSMLLKARTPFQEEQSVKDRKKSMTAFLGDIHCLFIFTEEGEIKDFVSYPGEDY